MNVSKGLLLNHLELFNHLGVLKVDLGLVCHVNHLLRRPVKVHIHHSSQVLASKFQFLDRGLVDLALLHLAEFLRHLVVLNRFIYDIVDFLDFLEGLELVFDVERKLLHLLVDQKVDLTINFFHFKLNFFVFDGAEFGDRLWELAFDVLCHGLGFFFLFSLGRTCSFDD